MIVPYLGKAFLRAYELEQSINTAAIRVEDNITGELERKFLLKHREIFPKEGEDSEKTFIISDMKNWSVPATIFAMISEQIPDLRKHEIPKFINTFCLYYEALTKYWEDMCDGTNGLDKVVFEKWDKILKNLLGRKHGESRGEAAAHD